MPIIKLRLECYAEEYAEIDFTSCGGGCLLKNSRRQVLVNKDEVCFKNQDGLRKSDKDLDKKTIMPKG